MLKTDKQEVVNHLKEQFRKSAAVICVDFRGVKVEKITQFRRQLQQMAVNYQVVKNTLAKRAIAETPFRGLGQFLVGPTGLVFCPDEPMESAKLIKKFAAETNGALHIKGGVVSGAVFDAKGIERVATLPPRKELLASLVGALQSPISGLVGTLEGIIREFTDTLQAIADQKSATGSQPTEGLQPPEVSEPAEESQPAEGAQPPEGSQPAEESQPTEESQPAEISQPAEG